jgi:peptide/nickel transport system substrate-binding protein
VKKSYRLSPKILLVGMLLSTSIFVGLSQTQPKRSGGLYGSTLVVSQNYGVPQIWVQDLISPGCWWEVFNIYDRLVELGVDCSVRPGLAYAWDLSSDEKTYTFHLYPNVTWHDGVRFTSQDVNFTYQWILDQNGNGAQFLRGIEKMECPDDNTIVITLKAPNAAFLPGLSSWTGATHIVAKHLFEDYYDNYEDCPATYSPVGTGPFKYVRQTEEYAELEANENYFKGRPYLDGLIYRTIKDPTTNIFAMKSGEIGYTAVGTPMLEVPDLNATPGVRVVLFPQAEDCIALAFQTNRAPFNDASVRRALAYAINRTLISELVYGGLCVQDDYFYDPAYESLQKFVNTNVKQAEYDPAYAEELLDGAGYPRGAGGIRFSFTLETYTYVTELEHVITVIKDQLAEIGVDAKISVLEYATFTQKRDVTHDFQAIVTVQHRGPDPDILAFYYKGVPQLGYVEYNNTRVNELFDLGISTSDFSARKVIYDELQEILTEDVPAISLIKYTKPTISREEYNDFFFQPPYDTVFRLYYVWSAQGTPWSVCDVNQDGVINIVDISRMAKAFATKPGDSLWDPMCDLDNNNQVNILDLAKAAKDFGKRASWPA